MLAASRALAGCGERALERSTHVFDRTRDDRVRKIVFQPLIPGRGELGTPDAATELIDLVDWTEDSARSAGKEALARCRGDKVDRVLIRQMASRETRLEAREILVESLGARTGSAIDKALVQALDDARWEVAVLALEAIAERRQASAERTVEKLLRSEEPCLVYQAALTLDAVMEDREEWLSIVEDLAEGERTVESSSCCPRVLDEQAARVATPEDDLLERECLGFDSGRGGQAACLRYMARPVLATALETDERRSAARPAAGRSRRGGMRCPLDVPRPHRFAVLRGEEP